MTEQFQLTRWSLQDLLEAPSGPPLDDALADLKKRTEEFEAVRPRLRPDMPENEFLDLIRQYEALDAVLIKVADYGELWFTEDTQNQASLSFKGRMEKIAADISNRTLFFSLWWKSLEDEDAERLMRNSGDFTYWLESLRRFKPHTLSEGEEKVINLKDTYGMSGLLTVYDMITNKYMFELTVDGVKKTMTYGELSNYYRHPSPEVRAAAYHEVFNVYSKDGPVLSQIYANRAGDWHAEQVQVRHFASPIAARNLGNDIPDAAVDTLLDVSRKNASLFQRYFRLKAKWLGLNPMRRSDIYAPVGQVEKDIAYQDAVAKVLDSYARFSPRLAEEARNVFTANHIDSETRPGKRMGAFCASTIPSLTPWVFVNYNNNLKDMTTLAHELGHAIHAQLARDHTLYTFHSTLPMAETASVFGEMILNDRLLEEEKDGLVRRDILARIVDDAYATVMRQAYFVLFEREAHPAVEQGKTLDEMNALYMENLRDQFGDSIEIPDDFKWEWIVIPHIFHTPFYTYAYSFGQLLTLSLYQRYREEGESFVPKYIKILSYGGSASPEHVLGEAGIDIRSAEFWQGGYDVIAGFIEQLESLEQPEPA